MADATINIDIQQVAGRLREQFDRTYPAVRRMAHNLQIQTEMANRAIQNFGTTIGRTTRRMGDAIADIRETVRQDTGRRPTQFWTNERDWAGMRAYFDREPIVMPTEDDMPVYTAVQVRGGRTRIEYAPPKAPEAPALTPICIDSTPEIK